MARPTKAEVEARWELQVVTTVTELVESSEEIEDDEGVVLVNRASLDSLVELCRQGQDEEDVELWIWANAPAAFRRAKRLLRNPAFLLAARGR